MITGIIMGVLAILAIAGWVIAVSASTDLAEARKSLDWYKTSCSRQETRALELERILRELKDNIRKSLS